ncbi:MAG TPA: phosphoglycerate dehydrogenase [Thermodesulfobacteriota bacterium]|nr:phosphoglycerate dehydrogenase [Thermodesulfobacteriota bacterium]
MRVLVADDLSPRGVEILRAAGLEVDVRTKLPPEEFARILGEYDGLVVRSATKVTRAALERAGRLKVIGRAGIGLDNIDLEAATARGIVVMNTPTGNAITTAEHTIAMMLALARDIPQATASCKAGKWEKNRFLGVEVFNKTLGVIGLGNIGQVVADRALGLKMKVIAYDPFLPPERARALGVELVDLDTLLAQADVITVHTPLTEETRGLLDAAALARTKRGVMIINCARGGIVDEAALAEAIRSGHVRGAALDVFEQEPPPPDHPLLKLPQVICTPHLGASTSEAQENVAVAIAEQIVGYLLHGQIANAANVPSVPADVLPRLKPWLTLAERLGAFESQVAPGPVEEVRITYRGEVAAEPTAPVTVSLLKGLLEPVLKEHVNFVNAPVLARERGVRVVEAKSEEAEDFQSLLTVEVVTPAGRARVDGTIIGKKEPRIVRVDDYRLEAAPEGHLLVMHNHDKPGVIGAIGTTLGACGINIARMHLGREAVGGRAISIINVDQPLTREQLRALQALPNVIRAVQVTL